MTSSEAFRKRLISSTSKMEYFLMVVCVFLFIVFVSQIFYLCCFWKPSAPKRSETQDEEEELLQVLLPSINSDFGLRVARVFHKMFPKRNNKQSTIKHKSSLQSLKASTNKWSAKTTTSSKCVTESLSS